ncbi:MAG: hypothetical protein LQ349_004885 [Xanthoria aureola]|nr:MAG: hypothetical protein LQ349_004885 [Xanthoria aureola]
MTTIWMRHRDLDMFLTTKLVISDFENKRIYNMTNAHRILKHRAGSACPYEYLEQLESRRRSAPQSCPQVLRLLAPKNGSLLDLKTKEPGSRRSMELLRKEICTNSKKRMHIGANTEQNGIAMKHRSKCSGKLDGRSNSRLPDGNGRQNRIILPDIVAADKIFRTLDDMPEIVERLSKKAKAEAEKQRLYVRLSPGD